MLAAISALLMMFMPLGDFASGESLLLGANIPLLVLVFAMVSSVLAAIFLYTNRQLQMRIVGLAFVLVLAFGGLLVFTVSQAGEAFKAAWPAFMPALFALLCVLALGGIRSDEKLVKSADRFR